MNPRAILNGVAAGLFLRPASGGKRRQFVKNLPAPFTLVSTLRPRSTG